MAARAPLAFLALLLLAPWVAAQGPAPGLEGDAARPASTVTFYAHVFSVGRDQPMPGNTQFPEGEDDWSRGSYVPCTSLAPQPITAGGLTTGPCEVYDLNVLYVYSTAGFVRAHLDSWDYTQFHNERGQAKDVLLDATQDVTATMYMSADAHPYGLCGFNPAPGVPWPFPCWNWDPGAHPDWQIEATLFLMHLGEYQGQASDPPPVEEMMRSEGPVLVAQGVSAPQTMLSVDANLNSGQGEVYEFQVNLGKPQVDKIPKEMDWVLRYRWWSRTGDQQYIAPLSWNVNSGEFYPVRFTLPVRNAFDVELVYPQFIHDKLLLHAMLNSPWGSYDVDPHSVRLEVTDERGAPAPLGSVGRVADFSVAHGGHYKPVNITWVWDYHADRLAPGVYKAKVSASNYQHSATSSTEARFRVNPDGSGTVLEIGRSGQATFTEDQLRAVEGGARGG